MAYVLYPPTPTDGWGSASEKRLQAARFGRSLEQEQDATGKRQKAGKKKQRARRKVQNGGHGNKRCKTEPWE
jgi:hypothetical protein